MRAILVLTFLLLMFAISHARITTEYDEYEEHENESLERFDSAESGSEEHAVVKKDQFRQIIFNPRKRRDAARSIEVKCCTFSNSFELQGNLNILFNIQKSNFDVKN